jgi:hypothetical protein
MPPREPSQVQNLGPVELLMEHTKEILTLENELRVARAIRNIAIAAIIIIPSVVLAIYIATMITWRKFDMTPITFPVILLIIGFGVIVGIYINYTTEANRIPSVQRTILALELARERRRMYAASLDLAPEVRRKIYRDDVPQDIDQFKKEGKYYRRINNALQAIVIVGSLAASTLTGLVEYIHELRWIAVGATFSVGVAAGFSGYFKFRERSFYLQLTADSIEHELSAVTLGIGAYGDMDPDLAVKKFTEHVELLKLEQRKRQQQLEQPSGGKESTQ